MGQLDPDSLATGDLEILGLMAGSSNYTFLARLCNGAEQLVVYKPRRGEAPLWDFMTGTLCHREVAAHLVARAAGWNFVPWTILRDGPLGIGAVQQFIDHDPNVTAFDLAEGHSKELMQIALFDVVSNNADRKAGHVLIDGEGQLWGIDHGLCFHRHHKLRTVLWDYVGEEIPERDLAAVERMLGELAGGLGAELAPLLHPAEVSALAARAAMVLESKVFPEPGPGRAYPWPPI